MEYPRKRGLVHDYLQRRSAGIVKPWSAFETVRGSRSFVQRLEVLSVLTGHDGCVNTVAWNDEGSLLLSGSDDCFLNIYEPWSEKCLYSMRSGHTANIFSAKFLPCTSDKKLVSCSGDGMVHYNELGNESFYGQHPFRCHVGTTYEVLVTPGDPHTFLTCGEDGTVREFDLRVKNKCVCNECSEDILIDCSHAVTSMSINPLVPYHIAVGCEDSNVRLFDRRTLSTLPESRSSFVKGKPMRGMFSRLKPDKLRSNRCRVTSLQYSQNGQDLLVSYCADYIYLFSLSQDKPMELRTRHPDRSTLTALIEDGEEVDGSSNLPPLKRLRLRGDWSDTGPNARPENEQGESSENSLLQRMSEVFTNWLEDAFRASLRSASSSGESSQSEDARPERPRSGPRGRLILGAVRTSERRSRAMRGANRSRASSSDSDQPLHGLQGLDVERRDRPGQRSPSNDVTVSERSPLPLNSENPAAAGNETSTETLEQQSDDRESETSTSSSLMVSNVRLQEGESTDHNEVTYSKNTQSPNSRDNDLDEASCSENALNGSAASTLDETLDTIDSRTDTESNACTDVPNCSNGVNSSKREKLQMDIPSALESLSEDDVMQGQSGAHSVEPCTTHQDDVEIDRQLELDEDDKSMGSPSNCSTMEAEAGTASAPDDVKDDVNVEDVISDSEEVEDSPLERGDRGRGSRGANNHTRTYLDENEAATRIQNCMRRHRAAKLEACAGQDVKLIKATKCYKGHRNARTMIKEANFWGEHYVISGSDCGRIFIWDRHTAELVTFMSGDRHVVNCVQPHPFDPVLASSGIDYDIKLWAPVLQEPNELANLDEVIRRNEQMLEESRDTITVPASFMLRMLASLSHVRGRRRQQGQQEETSDSETEND